MWHFQSHKVSKYQSTAGVYQVPDSVQFNQGQITDFAEPASPTHVCSLDNTI